MDPSSAPVMDWWLCAPEILEFQEQQDRFFQFPQPKTSHSKPSALGMSLYPPPAKSESDSVNQTQRPWITEAWGCCWCQLPQVSLSKAQVSLCWMMIQENSLRISSHDPKGEIIQDCPLFRCPGQSTLAYTLAYYSDSHHKDERRKTVWSEEWRTGRQADGTR